MKPIEVSQVNSYIKRVLQTEPMLTSLAVVGEVSNLKFHSSGNIYFSLKDEKSKLNCFLGSENFKLMDIELKEGIRVIASGGIFVYEVLGNYSLNVKYIELSGQGNLSIEFEKLKKKLEKEGFFEERHKLPIPFFPKTIGVVTSSSGAVVHDIIKSIKSKNTFTNIMIFPVAVSGSTASTEIANTIDEINISYSYIDIIIIGRGGGSMEELWAFNEEKVARSIYNSKIPIISAVGHETDFTISDFVADVRAATPTAAALMAVPDTYQVELQLDELYDKINNNLANKIKILEIKLYSNNFEHQKKSLLLRLENSRERLVALNKTIFNQINNKVEEMSSGIENKRKMLEAISPETLFRKGFSAILSKNKTLIRDNTEVNVSDIISVIQTNRILECEILEINERGPINNES
jgi:exodeoxyribonuclease VII large subunit